MNWKFFGKMHGAIYRWSGGRIGARMGWIDVALVETLGRKSGERRVAPIACYPYRDSIVLSASNRRKCPMRSVRRFGRKLSKSTITRATTWPRRSVKSRWSGCDAIAPLVTNVMPGNQGHCRLPA